MNAKTVIAVVVAIAVVGVGAVVYYLNRPAAQEASIDNALTALDTTEGASEDASGEGGSAATEAATADPVADGGTDAGGTDAVEPGASDPGDVAGTWTVDTTIGEFDFADATSTFVGFRVAEELQNVGQTEAVGRTPAVSGELTIDGTTLTATDVDADLTAMVSDIARRDGAMRRAMGTDAHPTATFTLTEPIDIGEVPAEGETVTFTALGDLTVNGTTSTVEFDVEAQIAQGNLLVVGRAPVVFADFGITAPQAGPVVSIEDEGTIELQLWFTR